MVHTYTKVCLTVIVISLAVIGLRGFPIIGTANANSECLDQGTAARLLTSVTTILSDDISKRLRNTESRLLSQILQMKLEIKQQIIASKWNSEDEARRALGLKP